MCTMSKNNLLIKAITCIFCTYALLSPEQSFAGSGALFDSGTNFLTALQDLLTNTWARIIAIIAVVFLGFAWMFGRISWQIAASVIGGIILIFGAPAIVDGISGSI
jgi:type IV secretion system protein VirB2